MEKINEKEDIFQKKLDDADIEIKWRYEYINEQVCALVDEELEISQRIVEIQVDIEVATILGDKKELRKLKKSNKRNNEYLEKLYEREDAFLDLFDEVFLEVLGAVVDENE